MPAFTEPRSGWSAECRDCPHTIGLDYGERIYPRCESTLRGAVEQWADLHRAAFPGHQPKIDEFTRWTMQVTEWAPATLEAIFGPVGTPADVGDQDAKLIGYVDENGIR